MAWKWELHDHATAETCFSSPIKDEHFHFVASGRFLQYFDTVGWVF